MSFLVDPPLLVATGVVAGARLADVPAARRVRWAALGLFLGTSGALYCNARWTRWMWPLFRARSGRDWMLNSGVTHFEHDRPGPTVHVAAVAMFALYPAWYRLGEALGRRLGAAR